MKPNDSLPDVWVQCLPNLDGGICLEDVHHKPRGGGGWHRYTPAATAEAKVARLTEALRELVGALVLDMPSDEALRAMVQNARALLAPRGEHE